MSERVPCVYHIHVTLLYLYNGVMIIQVICCVFYYTWCYIKTCLCVVIHMIHVLYVVYDCVPSVGTYVSQALQKCFVYVTFVVSCDVTALTVL